MLDLLQLYSLSDILIFLVIFAVGIKSFVTFWDWGVARLRKIFHKESKEQEEKDRLRERLDDGNKKFKELFDIQEVQNQQISQITDKIDLLIASDMDEIKSFITREHHYFCYQKGWIDDYSLDCIEKRYNHYKDEGGNSFVKGLMEEIRRLPKQPPEVKIR